MGINENTWKDKTVDQIYETEIYPHLENLVLARKQCRNYLYATIAVGVAIGSLVIGFASTSNEIWQTILGALMAIGVIAMGYLGYKSWKFYQDLRNLYKNEVVTKVVNCFGPDLNYHWKRFVDKQAFLYSNLFKKEINLFSGEDYVTGLREKVPFEFSELFAAKEEIYYEDGKKKKRTTVFFKGIFFRASFNKHINGETLVFPDIAESMFGSLIGNFLQSKNSEHAGKLIKLEDVEFEKKFAVYGTDQIESRYILTPALMQEMTKLSNKIKLPIYFSFRGEYVHVAVANNSNLFEPKLFGELVKIQDIEHMHNVFSFFMSIIDEMNLNTRIWSKTWENEAQKVS